MLSDNEVQQLRSMLANYSVRDVAEEISRICQQMRRDTSIGRAKGDPAEWSRLGRIFTTIAKTASV